LPQAADARPSSDDNIGSLADSQLMACFRALFNPWDSQHEPVLSPIAGSGPGMTPGPNDDREPSGQLA